VDAGVRAQKVESIPTVEKIYRKLTTLKAFANSSPGLSFGNPGENPSLFKGATLKELGRRLLTAKPRNPFRVANNLRASLHPGFQSKPWADSGQRFQRYSILARFRIFDFAGRS